MAAGAAPVGTAAHMPEVELAAELLDQALVVLGELGVALREQDVAVAWCHAQELHDAAIMPSAMPYSPASTGPGPGADVAQAVG